MSGDDTVHAFDGLHRGRNATCRDNAGLGLAIVAAPSEAANAHIALTAVAHADTSVTSRFAQAEP